MEHNIRINLFSTALVLAAGLGVSVITSTVVASRAYARRVTDAARAQQDMRVKGYARTRVRSDLGVWRITVTGRGDDLVKAFTELESSYNRVQKFIYDSGFSPDVVKLRAIETIAHHVRDEHGKSTPDVSGYTLRRDFVVTSSRVEEIAAASSEVTALIREGVHVISHPPQFTYSRTGDVKIEILGAAAIDARNRAEEIAGKSDCVITTVRDARQGVMQITQPHSTKVTSYGVYDTSTIEKDVSVVVTITFGIDRQ